MVFFIINELIPRTKIKRMNLYFIKKKDIEYNPEDIKRKEAKKEKIKKLKIKEPINNTYWNYGDIFTDLKERIKELKLKEPVKKSSWTDDF